MEEGVASRKQGICKIALGAEVQMEEQKPNLRGTPHPGVFAKEFGIA